MRKHYVNMDDASDTDTVSTDAPTSAGDNIQSAHIHNAVLFYVQYASGRSVRVNLLKVLDTTFTEEEMGNAKDTLWGLADEDLPGKNISRNVTDKRSKRYATCVDIVDAHCKVDPSETVMPSFLVDIDGYDHLPKYSPEDLNVVSINARLRELERQHTAMKSSITMNASATEKIENNVDTIGQKCSNIPTASDHVTQRMPSRLLLQANHPQDLQLYRNNQRFQCHNIPVMLTNQCLMEMFQQQITPLLNRGKMVNQRTVMYQLVRKLIISRVESYNAGLVSVFLFVVRLVPAVMDNIWEHLVLVDCSYIVWKNK